MRRRDGVVVEIVVASSDGRRSGNRLADRSVQRQTSQRATCWARWGWLSGKMARPFYSILAAPNQPLPLPNHQAQESAMSVLSTSVSVVSIFLPSRHRPPRSRHDLETRSAGCRSDRRVALSEKRTNTAIWFSIAELMAARNRAGNKQLPCEREGRGRLARRPGGAPRSRPPTCSYASWSSSRRAASPTSCSTPPTDPPSQAWQAQSGRRRSPRPPPPPPCPPPEEVPLPSVRCTSGGASSLTWPRGKPP